jgi:hypothetical protein
LLPLATLSGYSFAISYQVPLLSARLAELYQNSGEFVSHANRRLNELLREGGCRRDPHEAVDIAKDERDEASRRVSVMTESVSNAGRQTIRLDQTCQGAIRARITGFVQ